MRTNYEIRELVLADEDVLFGTTAIEISALDFYGDVLAIPAGAEVALAVLDVSEFSFDAEYTVVMSGGDEAARRARLGIVDLSG